MGQLQGHWEGQIEVFVAVEGKDFGVVEGETLTSLEVQPEVWQVLRSVEVAWSDQEALAVSRKLKKYFKINIQRAFTVWINQPD